MGFVKKNNVRAHTDLNVSEEFFVELEKDVEETINKAIERAKANMRRTLYGRDL